MRPHHGRVAWSCVAARRREAALAFLDSSAPSDEVLIVGASRHAADDLARDFAGTRQATFGIHRLSFTELAVRLALPAMMDQGRLPATALALDALAARATFEAMAAGELGYFAAVARTPGFRSALSATAAELRHEDAPLGELSGLGACDLEVLADRVAALIDGSASADRARILRLATAALALPTRTLAHAHTVVLYDVSIRSRWEQRLVSALAAGASHVFITAPTGDDRTRTWLGAAKLAPFEDLDLTTVPATTLARVQHFLFDPRDVPAGPPVNATPDVVVFSAPGEGRECVEIARRLMAEARAGTPFDRMAIVLRAPQHYASALEGALARAGIPAWFARGVQRPDPAGRAYLALLACADARLSARRFAEYLSLAQVPDGAAQGGDGKALAPWVPPDDELLAQPADSANERSGEPEGTEHAPVAPDAPVVHGSLRAPWRWESLLSDAAVIGGVDRWRRRLDGLAREYDVRLSAAEGEEPGSPRAAGLRRDREHLEHLRRFALPVVERLHAWPAVATWGTWLDLLDEMALRVLRSPDRVRRVLADLRPMGAIGPVPLREVREVLADRLSSLQQEPPGRRYGRVLVGTAEQVRGLTFDVVAVPGLAERVFPQRSRQDPLLLDAARAALDPVLARQETRSSDERLHLRLAVGAAMRKLLVSYPTIDSASGRGRVPSFYLLDVCRAVSGTISDHDALGRVAGQASQARLAWPAPPDPASALDVAEFDLAVLQRVLASAASDPAAARGRARYLLEVNAHLARALRARYRRWEQRVFTMDDGFCAAPGSPDREWLAGYRLRTRAYAPTALQRFSSCPYQFFLASVHRLQPRAESVPLLRLDPLTRGRMFHRAQEETLRTLSRGGALPVTRASLDAAGEVLDHALDTIAATYRDDLAPPIGRVWDDEIADVRADLRGWLHRLADADGTWVPAHIELGLGLVGEAARDPASLSEAPTIAGGWRLHGVVDLVERRRDGVMRVTDHKTGRNVHGVNLVVSGGAVLQPVLYGLAVEAALGVPVLESRLAFCTARGGYTQCVVPLEGPRGAVNRRTGLEVLEIIDRALEQGFLPAAPAEGACDRCHFVAVCGPHEARRTEKKARRAKEVRLGDLDALRGMA